ncbi:hypothetical protein E2C01_090458 [Portunus trituberculatus]|uniref:Uncharacterized protein n=1 Tax=Portunus trituberculatus TaxID=210409 RepID=A0A5B7JLU9_PORTR|nr:hypothetical protein [Portunus trituberculatus]
MLFYEGWYVSRRLPVPI